MLPLMRGMSMSRQLVMGALALVPKNQHGHPVFERDPDGIPRCPRGLRMHPTFQFAHTCGYRAQRWKSPFALARIVPILASTHEWPNQRSPVLGLVFAIGFPLVAASRTASS